MKWKCVQSIVQTNHVELMSKYHSDIASSFWNPEIIIFLNNLLWGKITWTFRHDKCFVMQTYLTSSTTAIIVPQAKWEK